MEMSAVYSTCLMYCAAEAPCGILFVPARTGATNTIRNERSEVSHLENASYRAHRDVQIRPSNSCCRTSDGNAAAMADLNPRANIY